MMDDKDSYMFFCLGSNGHSVASLDPTAVQEVMPVSAVTDVFWNGVIPSELFSLLDHPSSNPTPLPTRSTVLDLVRPFLDLVRPNSPFVFLVVCFIFIVSSLHVERVNANYLPLFLLLFCPPLLSIPPELFHQMRFEII
ncbi:hypothetical protein MUK42_07427 [Musa troglodytarum]|nr:hypothetical protein MUK42_07427 [Musa troglodytarum]URE27967.1 hypothetical protein MUK42_07427 [Musa troglodytarum]